MRSQFFGIFMGIVGGHGTLFLTLKEEHRLMMFKNRGIWKKFGHE